VEDADGAVELVVLLAERRDGQREMSRNRLSFQSQLEANLAREPVLQRFAERFEHFRAADEIREAGVDLPSGSEEDGELGIVEQHGARHIDGGHGFGKRAHYGLDLPALARKRLIPALHLASYLVEGRFEIAPFARFVNGVFVAQLLAPLNRTRFHEDAGEGKEEAVARPERYSRDCQGRERGEGYHRAIEKGGRVGHGGHVP